MTLRRMRPEDLPAALARIEAGGGERVDLGSALALVAEDAEGTVGVVAAHHRVQVEPLVCWGSPFRRGRAMLALARGLERELRAAGVPEYFCFTRDDRAAARFAHWGMREIYAGGRFFRREL